MSTFVCRKTLFGRVKKGLLASQDPRYLDFHQAAKVFEEDGAIGIAVYETDLYLNGKHQTLPVRYFLFGDWRMLSKNEALAMCQRLNLEQRTVENAFTPYFYYSEKYRVIVPKNYNVFLLGNKFK